MEMKNIENAMRFYLLATKLKYKIRSGWDETHWNINGMRVESIAEHIYGTCILAISLHPEFPDTNLDKVLKMLVIHEIGEVVIGDITPFEDITLEEKLEKEHEAVIEIIGDLGNKDELIDLMSEFDAKNTPEAEFAYYCDKLEADIQAKVYQDMGYQHALDDQENNVVMKSARVQKMIEDGATTAFDIWYEWDKDKFIKSPVFAKTLNYIKDHNTNI